MSHNPPGTVQVYDLIVKYAIIIPSVFTRIGALAARKQ
jgi:hypothetical protein